MNTPKTQYWRNVANHGRGAEMTKALHDACDEISKFETQVQELREALDKLINRNCQFNGDEARLRFGNFAEAISTVNDSRAILEKTK